MELKAIEKKEQGHYITRYDLKYTLSDGQEKVYEMISRDKNITTEEELKDHPVDAVVIIMEDESREKILINKEFRMATGKFVYNFPAGLIDPGECPEESARRELKEETGLDILAIEDVIHESYSAVGFSNEKNLCIIGVAGGTFQESCFSVEEITPGWYTKEEVRLLLKTEPFAARTQAYCYVWSREVQKP